MLQPQHATVYTSRAWWQEFYSTLLATLEANNPNKSERGMRVPVTNPQATVGASKLKMSGGHLL